MTVIDRDFVGSVVYSVQCHLFHAQPTECLVLPGHIVTTDTRNEHPKKKKNTTTIQLAPEHWA